MRRNLFPVEPPSEDQQEPEGLALGNYPPVERRKPFREKVAAFLHRLADRIGRSDWWA